MSEVTLGAALRAAVADIDRRDAEVLLAHLLGQTRAYLFAREDVLLTAKQVAAFHAMVVRVAGGEPVAYVTGVREFWSQPLHVTSDVLIPRPETECLVEAVLATLAHPRAIITECGTGSGAISLALATERPDWVIHATDICPKALAIAQFNAKRLAVRNVHFHQGDWCLALPKGVSFDALVSNPPYLSETDPHLPSLGFEPRGALVSGEDGLEAIRVLIQDAPFYSKPGGWVFLEHGFDQGGAVRALMTARGYESVSSTKDFSGLERVTRGCVSVLS